MVACDGHDGYGESLPAEPQDNITFRQALACPDGPVEPRRVGGSS